MIRWELLNGWSPERAWFLGVLYGDGNVHRGRKYYRVSASGSESTTRRWVALIAPHKEPKPFKRSPTTYQAYVDSKELVEWFEDHMAICGPKHDSLVWPEGLPEEYKVHFLRGVWDSDGSLCVDNRRPRQGNPSPVAKLGMNAKDFVRRVRKELEQAVGVDRIKVSPYRRQWGLKYRGKAAIQVADYLYADAPEHLRNEDRYKVYLEMRKMWGERQEARCKCGGKVKTDGLCAACWYGQRPYKTGEGTVCSCGKAPVLAKGLCTACYNRKRRSSSSYRRPTNGVCSCGNAAFRKGMCDRCYSAERRRLQREKGAATIGRA